MSVNRSIIELESIEHLDHRFLLEIDHYSKLNSNYINIIDTNITLSISNKSMSHVFNCSENMSVYWKHIGLDSKIISNYINMDVYNLINHPNGVMNGKHNVYKYEMSKLTIQISDGKDRLIEFENRIKDIWDKEIRPTIKKFINIDNIYLAFNESSTLPFHLVWNQARAYRAYIGIASAFLLKVDNISEIVNMHIKNIEQNYSELNCSIHSKCLREIEYLIQNNRIK